MGSVVSLKKPVPLVEAACVLAYRAHINQTRKDDDTPYFVHPCMVAMTLRMHGFSDEVVAAGFVHDVLEDTAVTQAELEAIVGMRVSQIVLEVTEDKTLIWEERKQKYIHQVAGASGGAKAVSVADKIHNLESLYAAYEVRGADVWGLFHRGKASKCWFERTLIEALQKTWSHPLLEEYVLLAERLETLDG